MLKPRSLAAVAALALIATPALAGDVDREIHVPAGWEGAYDFGYAPVLKVGNEVIVSGVPNGGPGDYEERTRRMYERTRDLLAAAGATNWNGVAVSAPGVVVLWIEGDRVAEHTDFVDYGAIQGQMAAASAATAGGAR